MRNTKEMLLTGTLTCLTPFRCSVIFSVSVTIHDARLAPGYSQSIQQQSLKAGDINKASHPGSDRAEKCNNHLEQLKVLLRTLL